MPSFKKLNNLLPLALLLAGNALASPVDANKDVAVTHAAREVSLPRIDSIMHRREPGLFDFLGPQSFGDLLDIKSLTHCLGLDGLRIKELLEKLHLLKRKCKEVEDKCNDWDKPGHGPKDEWEKEKCKEELKDLQEKIWKLLEELKRLLGKHDQCDEDCQHGKPGGMPGGPGGGPGGPGGGPGGPGGGPGGPGGGPGGPGGGPGGPGGGPGGPGGGPGGPGGGPGGPGGGPGGPGGGPGGPGGGPGGPGGGPGGPGGGPGGPGGGSGGPGGGPHKEEKKDWEKKDWDNKDWDKKDWEKKDWEKKDWEKKKFNEEELAILLGGGLVYKNTSD